MWSLFLHHKSLEELFLLAPLMTHCNVGIGRMMEGGVSSASDLQGLQISAYSFSGTTCDVASRAVEAFQVLRQVLCFEGCVTLTQPPAYL